MPFKQGLLFILFWLISISLAKAQVTFKEEYRGSVLHYQIFTFKDDNGKVGLKEILSKSSLVKFEPNQNKGVNYNFTNAAIWFKINIQPNKLASTDYLLKIGYPLLDSIDIYYEVRPGSWAVSHLGDVYPFSYRSIDHRLFLHKLKLVENKPATYFIRIRTSSSMVIPIDIQAEDHMFEEELRYELGYGIFYGMLIVMILFNLFIFLSLKDINYLFYPLAICGSLFYFLSLNGHMNQYILGEFPWWANKLVLVYMGLLATASALFAINFLDLSKYSRAANNLLLFVLFSGLLITLSAFIIEYSVIVQIAALLLLLDAVSLFLAGVISWYKGNKAARFFVLSWFFYLSGAVALIFRNFGILPHNFITGHAAEIGCGLEVIFLSLALSDKYRILRSNNEKAQRDALLMQQQANELLEKKVKERTAEINLQKEEIQTQRDNIEKQNRILELVNFDIKRHSDQVTSSIQYAKRIQEAILLQDSKIDELLPENFILYKPRDIVSGDFYWITDATIMQPLINPVVISDQLNEYADELKQEEATKVILAAVDCTGHGVPGAFMSLIGDALLHQIVNEKKVVCPGQILNQMHLLVNTSLHQNQTGSRDGMDIALCVIDKKNRTIEFSGAKNPLYMFQHQEDGSKSELEVVHGNRYSIGGSHNGEERLFTKHILSINAPTTFYIFTDGYQDQFGGTHNKKFMIRRFKQLLSEIYHLPMAEQKQILEDTITEWMNGNEQIDDILVIGIRV